MKISRAKVIYTEEMLEKCKIGVIAAAKVNKKPIIQLDLKANFIKEWSSQTEAAKFHNISSTTISSCCLGKWKTSAGFKWMFKKDYLIKLENEAKRENTNTL